MNTYYKVWADGKYIGEASGRCWRWIRRIEKLKGIKIEKKSR